MWYGLFLIIIAILAAGLTVVSAGAFTIILIVVAVIAAIFAGVMFLAGRNSKLISTTDAGATETVARLGGDSESVPGHAPVTAEEFNDARRYAS